jgi:hypothetical protein
MIEDFFQMHYFYLLFILAETIARLFGTLPVLEYFYAILGTTLCFCC